MNIKPSCFTDNFRVAKHVASMHVVCMNAYPEQSIFFHDAAHYALTESAIVQTKYVKEYNIHWLITEEN